ncbi:MAG TPA: hypothetical protein VK957_14405 [Lunatimonas sp.]|nr:hypothetical protein [Lunatimonas sp.]
MTKNYLISMQKGFLALISAALLFSCSQIEPFEMEGNDRVLFSVASSGTEGGDCDEDCITEDENSWFVKSFEHVYDETAPAKKLKVDVYNTPTQLIYKINTENTTIKFLSIGGVLVINDVETSTYTHVVNLGVFGDDWDACDTEMLTILGYRNNMSGGGAGNLGTLNTSYDLIGVCQDCDESFDYTMNEDGSYTFNYIPSEDMNDAELVFTFAQGVVVAGLNDWETKGSTKEMSMNLVACETYSWTVTLDTDCGGVGQPKANLWTDFKVNDESLKGDLENITKTCN